VKWMLGSGWCWQSELRVRAPQRLIGAGRLEALTMAFNLNTYYNGYYASYFELTTIMIDIRLMSPVEISTALGGRLKRRRLSLRMTQDELARRAGLNINTIRNLEAKTGASALDTILRVSIALGLVDNFDKLFDAKPKSIAQMEEAAEAPRLRSRQSRRQ
jgi:DNA-binding XRE family transcriptional regulator